jgi:transcriptional regulator with XRE-family HTH domain
MLIIVHAPNAVRTYRKEKGMSQRVLADLCGTQVSTICAAEHRPGLLPEPLRSKIEDALNRVERLRLSLLPAKLDLSDSAALQEALAAFERGDFARAAERAKAPENPLVVTF